MKKFVQKLIKVKDIFEGHINIPEYQREYTWKKELAEGLVDDFRTMFDTMGKTSANSSDYKNHLSDTLNSDRKDQMFYLGQVVKNKDEVVDGQQRITTIMLIFKALGDYFFKKFGCFPNRWVFLLQGVEGCKISSAIADRDASEAMQNTKNTYIEWEKTLPPEGKTTLRKTKFYKNYISIYKNIMKDDKENKRDDNYYHNFLEFIKRHVHILSIDIESTEDAISFFEIMNSKSTPLTAADLIKNHLIKAAGASANTAAESWNKINIDLSEYVDDLSKFIRYIYIAKYGTVSLSQLFNTIKEQEIKIIKDMDDYLSSYKKLINIESTNNPSIDAKLNFILKVGARESLSPILLEILRVYENDDIKSNELLEELVSFSFKYFYINGFKSNGYVNSIKDICHKIREKENKPLQKLWEVYSNSLKETDSEDVFTYNEEWFKCGDEDKNKAMKFARTVYPLLVADICEKNPSTIDSIEFSAINSLNISQLDIEHLYPKNPDFQKSSWEQLANEDHKWWMGNLIPISYKKNRTAKNVGFKNKLLFYKGLADSKGETKETPSDASTLFKLLFTNFSPGVNEKTIWNDEQIIKRTDIIKKQIEDRDLFRIKK